jgi:hypothetical protein
MRFAATRILQSSNDSQRTNEADTALPTMLSAIRTQVVTPHYLLGVKRPCISRSGRSGGRLFPRSVTFQIHCWLVVHDCPTLAPASEVGVRAL